MYKLTCPSHQTGNGANCQYCPIYSDNSFYSPYMYREMPMDDEFEDEIFLEGEPMDMMDEPKKSFTREEAIEIGEELGITFDKFDVEQFRMGLDVELEHGRRDPNTDVSGDDPVITGKIALAHLNEFPDYYTRLDRMEKEAKAYWENR
jgi:hypothetical protein